MVHAEGAVAEGSEYELDCKGWKSRPCWLVIRLWALVWGSFRMRYTRLLGVQSEGASMNNTTISKGFDWIILLPIALVCTLCLCAISRCNSDRAFVADMKRDINGSINAIPYSNAGPATLTQLVPEVGVATVRALWPTNGFKYMVQSESNPRASVTLFEMRSTNMILGKAFRGNVIVDGVAVWPRPVSRLCRVTYNDTAFTSGAIPIGTNYVRTMSLERIYPNEILIEFAGD